MIQIERGVTSTRVHTVVICELIVDETLVPIILKSIDKTPETLNECVVLSFNQRVGLRVVRGRKCNFGL